MIYSWNPFGTSYLHGGLRSCLKPNTLQSMVFNLPLRAYALYQVSLNPPPVTQHNHEMVSEYPPGIAFKVHSQNHPPVPWYTAGGQEEAGRMEGSRAHSRSETARGKQRQESDAISFAHKRCLHANLSCDDKLYITYACIV